MYVYTSIYVSVYSYATWIYSTWWEFFFLFLFFFLSECTKEEKPRFFMLPQHRIILPIKDIHFMTAAKQRTQKGKLESENPCHVYQPEAVSLYSSRWFCKINNGPVDLI